MIYISGPITRTDDYMERFTAVEKELTEKGYAVVNPARYNAQLPEETTYKDYMRVSLALLEACSSIYMLNGWQDSKGARLEHAYAEAMGINVMYQASTLLIDEKHARRLNGSFGYSHDLFLNLGTEDEKIFLDTKDEDDGIKTEFTDTEYKELAKRFGFPEDMFVKEEIE